MKKKIVALTIAVAMTLGLAACGSSSDTASTTAAATTAAEAEETEAAEADEAVAADVSEVVTVDAGVFTIATNAEFPPYEYHDNNEIVGIDMEICGAIADYLGLTLEIEDIAFDSIIPEVSSGKVDLGAGAITVTEDRKQNVDFSDTYASSAQVIIVQEDSDITGPDDLAGVNIGVQLGTTGDIYASDYEAEGSTIERYNKGFEAVEALTQGKIDAVVIDAQPAEVFVSENEGIKILDEALTEEDYAFVIAKGNTALLDAVNAALADLKESGTLQEIVDKYISAD